MMNDKNPLVASLLAVAKEWQKISMVKECIKEFNESTQKMDIDPAPSDAEPMQTDDKKDEDEIAKEPDLVLEVYEDKDYDIEEVKCWNFMNKKKQPKPDIIRTLVYKVPEVVKPKPVAPPAPTPAPQTPTSTQPSITPVSKSSSKSSTEKTKFSALHLTALDMAHYNHSASKVGLDADSDALDLNQFNPIGSNSLSEHFVPTSHNDVKSMLKDENAGHLKRSLGGGAKKPLPDEIQPLKSLNSHQISNKKAGMVNAPVGGVKKKIEVEIEVDEVAKVRRSLPAVVTEKRGRGRPPKNRAQTLSVPKKASSDEDDLDEVEESSEGEETPSDDADDEEFRSNPTKRLRLSAGRGRPPGTGRGRGRPPKEPKEVKEVKEPKKAAVEDVYDFNEVDGEDSKARRSSLRKKDKEEKLDESDSNSKRMFFKSKERKSVGGGSVNEDEEKEEGAVSKRRSSLRLSRSDEDKASSIDSVVRPTRKYRSHLSSLSEAAKMIEDEENAADRDGDKGSELNSSKSETRVTRSKAKLLDKSIN